MEVTEIDALDKELLNILQRDFPMISTPYQRVAEVLNTDETDVLERVKDLRKRRMIRQISAIFDSRALGYKSSLVAMKVDPDRADEAAEVINRHPGVSHNYLRDHDQNLWFTLTVHPARDLQQEVYRLSQEAGAEKAWLLPTLRLFKIGVSLDMTGHGSATRKDTNFGQRSEVSAVLLTDREVAAVRALQGNLAVTSHPFLEPAHTAGMTEEELLNHGEDFARRGVMRRFAAVLYHRKAGFSANAMAVWKVPEERIAEVGLLMASFAAVSHCYQRPTYPDWPYSVFSMIHGTKPSDCHAVVEQISSETGITEYAMLYSSKEYKKVRVTYFTDEDLEYARATGYGTG
jgi:siroheme decarboxylase